MNTLRMHAGHPAPVDLDPKVSPREILDTVVVASLLVSPVIAFILFLVL